MRFFRTARRFDEILEYGAQIARDSLVLSADSVVPGEPALHRALTHFLVELEKARPDLHKTVAEVRLT